MIRRRALLQAGPALGLLAAGCAADRVQVATTHGPDEGGIGGTGIFGVLTGRGSLMLNGLTLLTDAATRVETLEGLGTARPGDAVAVHAVPVGGALLATRVGVFHPLVGPLAFEPGGGFAVLGTPVAIAPDTVLRDHRGRLLAHPALRAGHRVAVSGLWRDDTVVASGLTLLPAGEGVQLRGLLRRRADGAAVGRTRLAGIAIPAALADRYVTVHGRATPSGLDIVSLVAESPPLLTPRVGPLAVEGFVVPNRDAPGFHLGGFGLPLAAGAAPLPAGRRALLLGRYAEAFAVDAAIALPDQVSDRVRLLSTAAPQDAIRRWQAG
jgi:hypothetical protein